MNYLRVVACLVIYFFIFIIVISFISIVYAEKEIDVNVKVVSGENSYENINDAESSYMNLNELSYDEEAVSSSVEMGIGSEYNSAVVGLASSRVSNPFFVPIALIAILFGIIIGCLIFDRKRKRKTKIKRNKKRFNL